MQINLKASIIKQLIELDKDFEEKLISRWRVEDVKNGNIKPTESFQIDLTSLSKAYLTKLEKNLIILGIGGMTLTAIQNWLKGLSDPANANISSLAALEKMLIAVIKSNSLKWLLTQRGDGNFVPCAITQVKYFTKTRDYDEARVYICVSTIALERGNWWNDDEDVIKYKKDDEGFSFYRTDLFEHELDGVEDYYDYDEQEVDDEDDEKPKRKGGRKKNIGTPVNLATLLSRRGLMLISEQAITKYNEQLSLFFKITKQIGKVYTCTGKGMLINEKKTRFQHWANLNEDGKTSKLVVDSVDLEDIKESVNTDLFGAMQIPIEPYILTYNLTMFMYVNVHVDLLEQYQFDSTVIENLVLSDSKKKLLSSLIGNENKFIDIIRGKSGGMVILCSGKPGLGKTLTAEVYAEQMQLPLYSIQSAQLGITVETIEQNLTRILARAEKWKAVLLIDEADCYVYERSNNILQNCIVGTFLRLMEYYNGILFLTTNRVDIIDDAILSRVTAHIKFDYPTKGETFKLWSIHSKNFNKKIDIGTVNKIWDSYESICGRDIRNLLKMLFKYNPKQEVITFEMIEELKDFIPFLKVKEGVKT